MNAACKQVGTLEGERNAVVYNESAFLATIRTTLSMLRSPPAPFEPLVLVSAPVLSTVCSLLFKYWFLFVKKGGTLYPTLFKTGSLY